MFAKIKKLFSAGVPGERCPDCGGPGTPHMSWCPRNKDNTIVSAKQGETKSTTLSDGRTATVSVKQDGSSASFDVE